MVKYIKIFFVLLDLFFGFAFIFYFYEFFSTRELAAFQNAVLFGIMALERQARANKRTGDANV